MERESEKKDKKTKKGEKERHLNKATLNMDKQTMHVTSGLISNKYCMSTFIYIMSSLGDSVHL